MTIDKTFFCQVMGRFATGVTVITTRSHQGLAGITANSFCSVSLDPPLVLVCLNGHSTTLPYFRDSGAFVVNILTEHQGYLSRCFATSSQERYEHFCHVRYHVAATGSPVIEGVLAFIDARIVDEYPGGDHVILLGQVVALGTSSHVVFTDDAGQYRSQVTEDDGELLTDTHAAPLAYYRGQYRHLAPDYQRPSLEPLMKNRPI